MTVVIDDLLIFTNQNLMSNKAGGAEKCLSGEFNQIMTFSWVMDLEDRVIQQ